MRQIRLLRSPTGALRPLLLTTLLAVLGSIPAGAQEPDTIPDPRERPEREERPERPTQPGDTTGARASERSPQNTAFSYIPPRFALSVTVSTFGLDELQSQPVVVKRRDATGVVLDSAFMGRSVEAEGGFQVGASALIGLGPVWALRGGALVGRTRLRPRYRGEEGLFGVAAARIAAAEASDATVVTAEAALRMRLPSSRRAQPYLEVGASAMEWRFGASPGEAPDLGGAARRYAGTAALGVDVPFSERWSARAQATSRLFRTPLDPLPAGTEGASSSTTAVHFLASPADLFADEAQELSTALRLEIGVSLGLGKVVTAPTDRAGPPASSSPPGR